MQHFASSRMVLISSRTLALIQDCSNESKNSKYNCDDFLNPESVVISIYLAIKIATGRGVIFYLEIDSS